MPITRDVLHIDTKKAANDIAGHLRDMVAGTFKRRGLVVGLSGGIDSSATAGLAVRALGKDRVLGLLMPEADSADETLGLSQRVADALGIQTVHEDITPILKAARCYERRDEAIATMLPGFGPDWKSKIVLPNILDSETVRFYSIVAQSPDGEVHKARMSTEAFLTVVAATNFKQRTRAMLQYFHADRADVTASVVAGSVDEVDVGAVAVSPGLGLAAEAGLRRRCPAVFALSGQDAAHRLHRGARCGEEDPRAPRVAGRTAPHPAGPGAACDA